MEALLAAVALINAVAVVLYALTSFGQAILFHIGWHMCGLASSGAVCDSEDLQIAVIYISFAGVVLFPAQLWNLRKHIDWPLAIHIAISQQFGLLLGEWILFTYRSVWMSRVLGLVFFVVALQKACTMDYFVKSVPSSTATLTENATPTTAASAAAVATDDTTHNGAYPMDLKHKALVYCVGLSSGVFGGMLGTGGPPLIWFAAHANLPSIRVRGTFALGFLTQNLARLVYIFFFQEKVKVYSYSNFFIFIVLSVSSYLSLHGGNLLAQKLNQDQFQMLLVVLLAGGSVLIGVEGLKSSGILEVAGAAALVFAAAVLSIRALNRARSGINSDYPRNSECPTKETLSRSGNSDSSASSVAARINPLRLKMSKRLSKYDTVRRWDDEDLADLDDITFDDLDNTEHGGSKSSDHHDAAFGILPRLPQTLSSFLSSSHSPSREPSSRLKNNQTTPENKARDTVRGMFNFGTPVAAAPASFYAVLPQTRHGNGFEGDEDDVLF